MIAGSSKPMSEKLKKYFVNENGCWIWIGSVDKDGYGRIRGSKNNEVYVIRAPRASYTFHIGEIGDGLMVLHHCDVPACINPQHLYLGTQAENGRDKKIRGRARTTAQFGENNGMFGKVGDLNPFYGCKHSEETKAKIRKTIKEKADTKAEFLRVAS